MYWPREWPVFLKHTLQVPLRVTGALRHFFQRQGRFQVILDPRQNTMDSDGVIITSGHHLTSSYFYGRTFLSSCSSMATSSADRFFVNSWCNFDPQPDDTARKGRRPASTAPARRACQRGWVTVQSSLCTPGGRACVIAPGSTESTVFSSTGVIHTSQRMEQSTRNWVAVISIGER